MALLFSTRLVRPLAQSPSYHVPNARYFMNTSRRSALSVLKIDQTRLWDTIHHTAKWGASPEGGVKRLTLTQEDKSVRKWFQETTKKYGCTVKVDAMGNMFAIRPGQNKALAPIGIGSHLDTQPLAEDMMGFLVFKLE